MAKRYSHDDYKEKLLEVNPNLDMISAYKNSKTKIRVKNKICNHEWDVIPTSLLLGHSCPICSGRQKKTHEQFVKEVAEINPNIKVLSEYKNSTSKIECECLVCGRIWEVEANSILQGRGCGYCYGSHLTDKEFKDKLHFRHPNIITKDKYINGITDIHFYCLLDNTLFKAKPKYVLRNEFGCCPTCESEANSARQTWTNDYYVKQLFKATTTIVSLEPYVLNNVKIKHKCLNCNTEWLVSPNMILAHPHCPKCDCSKGEHKISEVLDSCNISYIHQKKFPDLRYKNPLSYDFYLPDYNLLIEYDGEFHYKPIFSEKKFEIEKIRDSLKDEYAKKNHFNLLRIPYWEYENIEETLKNSLFKGGTEHVCKI